MVPTMAADSVLFMMCSPRKAFSVQKEDAPLSPTGDAVRRVLCWSRLRLRIEAKRDEVALGTTGPRSVRPEQQTGMIPLGPTECSSAKQAPKLTALLTTRIENGIATSFFLLASLRNHPTPTTLGNIDASQSRRRDHQRTRWAATTNLDAGPLCLPRLHCGRSTDPSGSRPEARRYRPAQAVLRTRQGRPCEPCHGACSSVSMLPDRTFSRNACGSSSRMKCR